MLKTEIGAISFALSAVVWILGVFFVMEESPAIGLIIACTGGFGVGWFWNDFKETVINGGKKDE